MNVTTTVLLFGIYLFLLKIVLALQQLSLHWEILIMLLYPSVSMDFLSYSERDALFHSITYDYSCADCNHLRYVPGKNTFKLGSSAPTCEFCEWVQVGIGVYLRSSLTHFHLHAAAIAHRNHFFCVYQQNKSSESKVKF